MTFASGYVPGAVSGFLASDVTQKSEQSKLADLFTVDSSLEARKRKAETSDEISTKTKKVKKHRESLLSEDANAIKKLKAESDASKNEGLKRTRPKRRSKEKENRTIFVGNVNNTSTKKSLKRFFKQYGDIENLRLRSAAPADPKIPKKGVIAMKDFHDSCHTINAYIVYKELKSAKEALQANGQVFDGLTLRVDSSTKPKEHNHDCSIFVGNLPFDIEEEVLRRHFVDCGKIVNIRLIKDKRTRIGKGFGYVLFENKEEVDFALQLNGRELSGRKLRIQKSSNKPSSGPINSTEKIAGARRKKVKRQDGDNSRERLSKKEKLQVKPKTQIDKKSIKGAANNSFKESKKKSFKEKDDKKIAKQNEEKSLKLDKKKSKSKDKKVSSTENNVKTDTTKHLTTVEATTQKKRVRTRTRGKSLPSNASKKDYEGIHARKLLKIKKKQKMKKKQLSRGDNVRRRMRKKQAKN